MADEPTLGEIARGVTDVRLELRAMRGELVRGDVYTSNRQADDMRLKILESDLKRQQDERDSDQQRQRDNGDAMRRLVYGAIFAGVGSVAVQGILAVMNNKP